MLMSEEEFRNLERGDIVRGANSGTSYVVERTLGTYVIGVRTVLITNPDEWVLVKKSKGGK